jgi:hypothetical protein
MAESTCTELVVRSVGKLQRSPKNHPFLECLVDGGVVAVWGSHDNMANIETVSAAQVPFRLICDCIPSKWDRHDLWVYEKHNIYTIESIVTKGSKITSAAQPDPTVSLNELSDWRRQIVAWVSTLEKGEPATNEGLAGRIGSLSRAGTIPREIAALMKAVTEMRNAAEYDAKVLTKNESLAIRNAWLALGEWARSRSLVSTSR